MLLSFKIFVFQRIFVSLYEVALCANTNHYPGIVATKGNVLIIQTKK